MADCTYVFYNFSTSNWESWEEGYIAPFRGTNYAITNTTAPTVPGDIAGNSAALVKFSSDGSPTIVDTASNVFSDARVQFGGGQEYPLHLAMSSEYALVMDEWGGIMRLFHRVGETFTLTDSVVTTEGYITGCYRVDDTHFIIADRTAGDSGPVLEMWTIVDGALYPVFYTERNEPPSEYYPYYRWLAESNGYLLEINHEFGLWLSTYTINDEFQIIGPIAENLTTNEYAAINDGDTYVGGDPLYGVPYGRTTGFASDGQYVIIPHYADWYDNDPYIMFEEYGIVVCEVGSDGIPLPPVWHSFKTNLPSYLSGIVSEGPINDNDFTQLFLYYHEIDDVFYQVLMFYDGVSEFDFYVTVFSISDGIVEVQCEYLIELGDPSFDFATPMIFSGHCYMDDRIVVWMPSDTTEPAGGVVCIPGGTQVLTVGSQVVKVFEREGGTIR